MMPCVFALATILAASADQSGAPRPNPSGETPRVVQKLPPVNFGGAPAALATAQSTSASAAATQRRGETALRALTSRKTTRTVCGLTMIEQSPDLDAKMLMPPDPRGGAAVRRIEPQTCTASGDR